MTEEQYNEVIKSIREHDGIPPIEDLIERSDIPLVPEMSCDSSPKPPSAGTMTDLHAQAKDYAVIMLNSSDSDTFTRQEMYYALVDAYMQGWIDCDMEGDKPETQDEYFNDAPDCRYFSEGNCTKGLPGTPCERVGCAAYYPKEKLSLRFPLVGETEPYVYDPSNRVADWSVHIDLARCTPAQLRFLAEHGHSFREWIQKVTK